MSSNMFRFDQSPTEAPVPDYDEWACYRPVHCILGMEATHSVALPKAVTYKAIMIYPDKNLLQNK